MGLREVPDSHRIVGAARISSRWRRMELVCILASFSAHSAET